MLLDGKLKALIIILSSYPSSALYHYRQFIQNSYKSIKSSNPELPFLVREAQGTPARIFARFGEYMQSSPGPELLRSGDIFELSSNHHDRLPLLLLPSATERGVEKSAEVDGLSEQEVQKKFEGLLS